MGNEGGQGRRRVPGRFVGIGLATVLIAVIAAHVWHSIHLKPALPMSGLGARLAACLPALENDRSAEVASILAVAAMPAMYSLPEAPAGYRWAEGVGPLRGPAHSRRVDLRPDDVLLGPWTPESRPHLAAVIAHLGDPAVKSRIDALVELSEADWRFDPWGVLGPRVPPLRFLETVTPMLLARARYEHAQRGDVDAAWRMLRAALATCERLPVGSFRALGLLFECESRALRELGHMLREVPLSVAWADEIARYLAGRPTAEQAWMQAVQGELCFAEALLDAGFTCEPDGDGVIVLSAQLYGVGTFTPPLVAFPGGAFWNVAGFLYHRRPVALSNIRAQADSLARAFRAPPESRWELVARAERGQAAITALDGPMLRFSPFRGEGYGIEGCHAAVLMQEAWTHGVRTLLAINRYRAAHGRVPSELTELLGDWLAELPQDPFGGGPLRYRSEGNDAFTLWSIGPDGRDNGGACDLDYLYPRPAGCDLVFTFPRAPPQWEPILEPLDPAAASLPVPVSDRRPNTRPADGAVQASPPQEE